MEIAVSFGQGMQVNAQFEGFTVPTDQPESAGGMGNAPDPFSYFLSSLATCAGFYVLRFCQTRQLSTEGLTLHLTTVRNPTTHRLEDITITIDVPATFPSKYVNALVRAANECSVKKVLADPPNIQVKTHTALATAA